MFGTEFAVFNDGLMRGAILAPDDAGWVRALVIGLYTTVLVLLWLYGLHRYHVMWMFRKHLKDVPQPLAPFAEAELPPVTVQLAVFNEMYVVERLIDTVCQLDYPADKLQIQVVDDSTDETYDIVAARVALRQADGHNIVHIHRDNREGFKAGALENGLKTASGEFIVMFDADFLPPRDFIRRQVHHFSDPKVGFVQARWAHLNEGHSLLTRLQAIFLDGHFVLEHTGRQRSGRFFTFSGTAGTWRKETIADAGGWQHDTLVEDCDLSYRCQLKGWRGVYLVDQAVPAELPVDMNGFKSQQHRWAKGFIQAMKKILPTVWRSDASIKQKIEATFHLSNNLTYLLMVALSVLMLPALYYRSEMAWTGWAIFFDASLFLGATASVLSFYAYAERQIDPKWWKKLHLMPLLMSVGIGMSLNQSKAVIEAFLNQTSPFVRTPKYSVGGEAKKNAAWEQKKYKAAKNLMPMLELFFAFYYFMIMAYAVWQRLWLAIPFLGLFFFGFAYVGGMSVAQARAAKAPASQPATLASSS
jgi:cellulose synthase/poly-beta-1,6-N-acetylglucosamine synthase-like glycosyltransferase